MKHAFLIKVLFISAVAAVVSCHREDSPPEPSIPDEGMPFLTIDDARALFSEYTQTFSFHPTALTRTSDVNPYTQLLEWDGAKESTLVTYPVVEIPARYAKAALYRFVYGIQDEDHYPQASNDNESIPEINAGGCLIAGLNSWNEPYFRMLYILPDDSFIEETGLQPDNLTIDDIQEGFSGALRLYDTDGYFTKGYILQQGYLRAMIYPVDYVEQDTSGDNWEQEGVGQPLTRARRCMIYEWTDWIQVLQECPRYDIDGKVIIGEDIAYCLGLEETKLSVEVCEEVGAGSGGEGGFEGDGEGLIPGNPGDGGKGGTGKVDGDNDKNKGKEEEEEEEEKEEERKDLCIKCGKYPCECPCDVCGKYPCVCNDKPDPCDEIMKMAYDRGFQLTIEDLKNFTGMLADREYGYTFAENENGFYDFSSRINGPAGQHYVVFNDSDQKAKWDGVIHTHFPGGGNLFSFMDLAAPYTLHATGMIDDIMTFKYGVVTRGGVYFLMVNDFQKYLAFWGRSFRLDTENNKIKINEYSKGRMNYLSYSIVDAYNDPKSLAYFLEEYNTGLTLMEQSNFDGSFTEYKWNNSSGRVLYKICGITIEL